MPVFHIAFIIEPGPEWARNECAVTPWIGGEPFTELVARFERIAGFDDPAGGYAGINCDVGDLSPALERFAVPNGGTGSRRHTELLGCACGTVDCWPLKAVVVTERDRVIWREFRQPFRPAREYSEFGPFAFDRSAYDAALAAIG